MMKKYIIFLLIFAISGCGTKIYNENLPQQNQKYLGAVAKCDDNKINKKLETKINELLKKEKIPVTNDLSINCNLLKFDEGNRAVRYLIGFGAGAATSSTNIKLYNKNQNIVGEFDINATIGMGGFGGDAEEVLDFTAQEVINRLKAKNFI